MSEAGLNTVNLSQMTTWQQVLLWLLIIIGSSIWVSIWTVLIRKHAFERRFKEIVKRERQRSLRRRNSTFTLLPIAQRFKSLGKTRGTSVNPSSAPLSLPEFAQARYRKGAALLPISNPTDVRLISTVVPPQCTGPEPKEEDHQPATDDDATGRDHGDYAPSRTSEHIAFADQPVQRAVSTSVHHEPGAIQRHLSDADAPAPELAATVAVDRGRHHGRHKVGRNAQFHGLTNEEREKLGGTEYRALRLLSFVVPFYFVSWQFFGSVALGAWIARYQPQPALDNGISPWWNGIFNGVSAFNNSGSMSDFYYLHIFNFPRTQHF